MTTLHIPDDLLAHAGISEAEALLELACSLFDAGRLTVFQAARLAGMSQPDFEDLLLERGIALHRITRDDLRQDLRNLRASAE
jgi:predicted HTH domain antitoxin